MAARFEQESEFFAVGEGMEKQEKQNYKHEVHLLVPNNHFVVPVIEILYFGKVAVLDMVEVKMHLERVVVEMEVEVAARMAADTLAEVEHTAVVVAVADSEQNQLVALHMSQVETRALAADYTSVEKRR